MKKNRRAFIPLLLAVFLLAGLSACFSKRSRTFILHYDPNGGICNTTDIAYTAGEEVNLSVQAERPGYVFLGWSLETEGEILEQGFAMPRIDLTIYAQYEVLPVHNVVYDIETNHGVGESITVSVEENAWVDLTGIAEYDSALGAKNFAGWHTSPQAASGIGAMKMGTEDLTLYAVFNENPVYIIAFDCGGAQYGGPLYKIEGTGVALPITAPTREGYVFMGWADHPGDTAADYQPGSLFALDADTLLYAVWKESEFSRALLPYETWGFSNSYANFASTYDVSDADFAILANYVRKMYSASSANTVINSLQSLRLSDWGGSCYGISVTALLQKSGNVAMLNHFGNGAATLYNVGSPKHNDALRSAINYYMISQKIPALRSAMYKTGAPVSKTAAKELIASAKAGKGILFCYFWDRYGHAIVITGYSRAVAGGHMLAAWDNRYPGVEIEVYVSADYQEMVVDGKENVEYFEYDDSLSVFDSIDLDGKNNDYLTAKQPVQSFNDTVILSFPADPDMQISNEEGQVLSFVEKEGLQGSMPFKNAYFLVGGTAEGQNLPARFVVEVEKSASYSVESGGAGISLSVEAEDAFVSVDSQEATAAVLSQDLEVTVQGDAGFDFTVRLGGSDTVYDLAQVEATGREEATVTAGEQSIETQGLQRGTQADITIISDTVNEENTEVPVSGGQVSVQVDGDAEIVPDKNAKPAAAKTAATASTAAKTEERTTPPAAVSDESTQTEANPENAQTSTEPPPGFWEWLVRKLIDITCAASERIEELVSAFFAEHGQ